MKILYIEPYYSGSHKTWIDSYQKYSKNTIKIISLPGNKWKWRMHGGAITLANQFLHLDEKFDLILCSDFLNLPVFKSICDDKIKGVPIIMYFHENQLSYPWSPKDKDVALKRDLHYHYVNYTSSLVSDFNLFNSKYHLDSYIDSLEKYLKKMPDFNNFESLDLISNKSSVLYIGCELEKLNGYKIENKSTKPLILWNHRWEFDKNPEILFKTLFKLSDEGIDFELALLGKEFKESPQIFNEVKSRLSNKVVQFGYCDSFKEYAKWLWKADILPVTSNQDFFGISIVEAVYCQTLPILPKRLSYTELFDSKKNSDYFYEDDKEFYQKLKDCILNYKKKPLKISSLVKKYDWKQMVSTYDKTLNDFK